MHILQLSEASEYIFVPREVIVNKGVLGYTVDIHADEHLHVGAKLDYGSPYTVTAFFTHTDGSLCVELIRNDDNIISWDTVRWAKQQRTL